MWWSKVLLRGQLQQNLHFHRCALTKKHDLGIVLNRPSSTLFNTADLTHILTTKSSEALDTTSVKLAQMLI